LKALFVSEELMGNKLAKTAAGQEVHTIVLSVEFWNSVEDCLKASAPLLIIQDCILSYNLMMMQLLGS